MPFIVKKKIAKSYIIYCEDGGFHAECFVGPLQESAKIYKTWAAADKRAKRKGGVVGKVNDMGEEIY